MNDHRRYDGPHDDCEVTGIHDHGTYATIPEHSNLGIRWQAQMEHALAIYRERVNCIRRIEDIRVPDRGDNYIAVIANHAAIANAAATVALALAMANAGSDIEVAISKLQTEVEARF